MRSCLATAASKQKTRLIIGLRANVGGQVQFAYDMFKQLFPDMVPWGGTNLTVFDLLNDVGSIITQEYQFTTPGNRTVEQLDPAYSTPFNANDRLDARLDDYDSWSEFYGPIEAHGANFIYILRYNLSGSFDTGNISVSGYANLSGITSTQVFKAEDIVLLQDGICGSTCAVLSEFVKSQA